MKHWYVLRSKPKKEHTVASLLQGAGIEIYLPQIKVCKKQGGPCALEPLFPCYLFGHLDPLQGELRLAHYTTGIRYVVGYGHQPQPVPETLIMALHERLAHGHAVEPLQEFRQGDRLVIADGPLQGMDAIFDRRLSRTGRVQVLVQILERFWRTELDITQLRLADPRHGVYSKSL